MHVALDNMENNKLTHLQMIKLLKLPFINPTTELSTQQRNKILPAYYMRKTAYMLELKI